MKRASAARYDSSFDAIADESRVRDVERLSRFSRILKCKHSGRPWNIEGCNRCYREQTRKRFNYISRDASVRIEADTKAVDNDIARYQSQ